MNPNKKKNKSSVLHFSTNGHAFDYIMFFFSFFSGMISLHYANVTVGTPAQWFLVALDTGSHLFWLPCNCNSSCVRSMETDQGEVKLISWNASNINIKSCSSFNTHTDTCMNNRK